MKKYAPDHMDIGERSIHASLKAVDVYIIEDLTITGKAKKK